MVRALPPLILALLAPIHALAQVPNPISVTSPTINESVGATRAMPFIVSVLRTNCLIACTVDYTTQPGTASAGSDYTTRSGTLTFPPNAANCANQAQQVDVAIVDDAISEPHETVNLLLSNASTGCNISNGTGVGTILNDDVALLVNDPTGPETGVGAPPMVPFRISVQNESVSAASVAFQTSNGTAIAGVDYNSLTGNVSIPANSTGVTINVTVIPDTLDENDETINFTLSNPQGATLADGTGVGRIIDDDPTPSASISNPRPVTEGNAGTQQVAFVVSLSAASGRAVRMDWATANVEATSGADYVAGSGTLTFPAGTTQQTISVTVNADLVDELDETFAVNLSNPQNITLADAQGIATIDDDDLAPTASINDVQVAEGDTNPTNAVFTVTLTNPSSSVLTMSWATANDSATAGSDYAAGNGTLTFNAGVTSLNITVAVTAELIDEDDETFRVNLSNPSAGVTIADAQAIGTITDDDGPPTISIADVTVNESNDAVFTLSLSAASSRTITVQYATSNGTAGASDYTAASGTITFTAGQSTRPVTVVVAQDALDEANETFTVTLTNPSNATIADASALGTITDDDADPALSIADLTVGEGDGSMAITIALSQASGRAVSVGFATANGTASGGTDYTGATGTAMFSLGSTEQTITVAISNDALDEPNETFTLNLTNPTNASIAVAQAIITITDDDQPPEISIADAAGIEGDDGTESVMMVVSLSSPSSLNVEVAYATMDDSALAGSDYVESSGILSFVPGVTEQTIVVEVVGDLSQEAVEQLTLVLSSPLNASLADAAATLTITDDDLAPDLALSVSGGDFTVGDRGAYTFTVENVGEGPTTAPIVLSDRLPLGLTLVETSGDGWLCSDEEGLLTCSSSIALAAGDALADLIVSLDVGPEAFPTVSHTATVAVPGDPVPANDAVAIGTSVIGLADLSLAKSRPDTPAEPGTEISWTITVTNLGPTPVDELFVVDQIPASIADAAFAAGAGSYDANTGLLSGISLVAGDSVELTVSGVLAEDAAGTLINVASVSVAQRWVDPQSGNDEAMHSSMIAGSVCDDEDGLTNEEESDLGTDECNPDTDGDGILDGTEVDGDNPTDPRDPDSDNDGLCDGSKTVAGVCIGGEDRNDNGRRDPNETDPNDEDTDDGGVPDGEEVAAELNPLDHDDDVIVSSGCDCSTTDRTGDGSLLLLFLLFVFSRARRR